MSQDVRQSNLFASEDFTKVYKSFSNVDFRAYDYDTLRQAMIDYLVLHYPEDFNDYIESSEYIAMIDLLAYLGTSLSFRMDLNSRENMMDTAERRESVIRLARMINYKAKRNRAAEGMFKLTGIQTTEPITDSLGRNLANSTIFWNDPNNPDSFDQFTSIANAAFVTNNPFGKPYKRGTIGDIPTDLYQLNNVKNVQVAYPISVYVNDESLPFDIVNVDFDDGESFYEVAPDPANAFNVVYRNDGQGLSSANTGFFLYFKQGTLQNVDSRYDFPVENRIEELNLNNVNETDVYVQEINEDGEVQEQWTAVPSVVGNENIYFNNIDRNVKTIYEVITGQNDTISIQFADGNFGDVPTGIFRTWARVSANTSFTLRPEEAQNLEITIPYVGNNDQEYSLRLIFSLEESISNSSPSETNEEIKLRSPQVYYTQDRMVNNEDYNVFPLSYGTEIVKAKTINRTNSGHSRYIDINDPTGFHQNLLLLADDGALYKDQKSSNIDIEIDDGVEAESGTIIDAIQSFLKNRLLTNFFYDDYLLDYRRKMTSTLEYDANNRSYYKYNVYTVVDNYQWSTYPESKKNNTGCIIESLTGNAFNFNNPVADQDNFGHFKLLQVGSKIKFAPSKDSDKFAWGTLTSVASSVFDDTVDGKIFTLDVDIPNDWYIVEITPSFERSFSSSEIATINLELEKRNNFGLAYDVVTESWTIFNDPVLDINFDLEIPSASWLATATYIPESSSYLLNARGTRYIFESYQDIRFFFEISQQTNFDIEDLTSDLDVIEILDTNHGANIPELWTYDANTDVWVLQNDQTESTSGSTILLRDRETVVKPTDPSNTLTNYVTIDTNLIDGNYTVDKGMISIPAKTTSDNKDPYIYIFYNESNTQMVAPASWNLFNSIYESDGYLNPAKAEVIPADTNKDGIPDEPFLYRRVVSPTDLTFFENYTDIDDDETIRLWASQWNDLRSQITTDDVPLSYYDLVNQDLFLIDDAYTSQFESRANYLIANELLSRTSADAETDINTDLTAISNHSTFVERYNNGELITASTSSFSPMMNFDVNSNAVTELTEMKAAGQYLDISTNPPEFKNVDWTDEGQTAEAIRVMQTIGSLPQAVTLVADDDHYVRNGRSFTLDTTVSDAESKPFDFKWKHFSPDDHRIDPSISNIMDMLILTNSYYDDVLIWKKGGKGIEYMPEPLTSEALRVQFSGLNDYKMMSDQIIFAPAKFKVLFGPSAESELRATFKVVKLPTTLYTDNEIKSKTVEAIDSFFDIDNWDFGETFYYTELAAFIHKELASIIGSVVLVPNDAESQFGDLFQIKADPNELFISTATVANVEIVNSLTDTNMRL